MIAVSLYPHARGATDDYFKLGLLFLIVSVSTFYFARKYHKGALTFLAGVLIFGLGVFITFDWLSPLQFVSSLDTVASVITSILLVLVGIFTMGAAYKDNCVENKADKADEPEKPGYFDRLADSGFKKTDDGNTIYYPNGVLGKGRIVQDEAKELVLRNFNKRTYKYFTPVCMIYGAVLGWSGVSLWDLLIIVSCFLLLIGRQRYLIYGLPVYDQRLTVKEAMSKGANTFNFGFIKFSMAISVLMIIVAFTLPFLFGKSFSDIALLVLLLIALALLNLILYGYFYRLKKSSANSSTTSS